MMSLLFGRGLDEDWVDRVNGFWSVLVLTLCSLGSFLIRYITHPISCFLPSQFTSSHARYTYDKCFLKDTFHVPHRDPTTKGYIPTFVTSYHLWIPVILFIQAFCFKIPHIFWTIGKRHLLFNVDETIGSLQQAELMNEESRTSMFKESARIVDSELKKNRFLLSLLYLVVKLLFLLNTVGQIILIFHFFRKDLLLHIGMSSKSEGLTEPFLLKKVVCGFAIRQIQNIHRYSAHCNFPITEVYEKMYVFLWYWIFFVGIATLFNLLLWAGFLFIPFLRDGKISAYINAAPGPAKDSSSITRFVSSSLGLDGVLLVSMISQNSSEMVAANLSQEMYQVFLEKDRPTPYSQPETSTSAAEGFHPGSETVVMTNMDDSSGRDEKPPLA